MEQNTEFRNRPIQIQSTELRQVVEGNTMEKKHTFQELALEQPDIHMQKKKKESRYKTYTLHKN